jgi:hypothetical protein
MEAENKEMRIVTNTFLIRIEDKDYFIYESYIKNGSGYTFAIYKSSKLNQRRDNYYFIDYSYKQIVIIGKEYNYLLVKNDYNNKFEFNLIKYDKNILKCVCDDSSKIYLEDKKIYECYGIEKLFKNDMLICKNMIRKEKLIKINE